MLTFALPLLLAAPQLVGGEFKKLATIRNGFADGATLGNYLRDVGDADGDGMSDFALAIPDLDRQGLRDVGIVLVFSGRDGAYLREVEGTVEDLRFGSTLDGAGDFDADGFADLVAGGRRDTAAGELGQVRVVSVRTGAVLFTRVSSAPGDGFGTAVAGVGDLDGDGHGDIAIGRPGVMDDAGLIEAWSGRTHQQFHEFRAVHRKERIGYTVFGVGDLDMDGIPDVATANLLFSPGNSNALGRVAVYSTATERQIWARDGCQSGELFGWDLAAAGDVNADGVPDLVIGAPGWGPNSNHKPGGATIVSGADGGTLLQVSGPHHRSNFGGSVDGGVDVDGDGRPDVLIGALFATLPNGAANGGAAFLFSGADGRRLHSFPGRELFGALGGDVAFLGLEPGTGNVRMAIGEPGHFEPTGYGAARLVAFRPYLSLDANEISAAGGTVQAIVDFPDESAGSPYLLLLSRTGIGPSDYGGLQVPLTQDTMFTRAAAGEYPVGTSGTGGALDAFGNAAASYTAWTPILSQNVGATFWFAAVALHPTSGLPMRSSVALPLRILP